MQLISCAVILLHYELGYLVCMLPVTRSDSDVSVIQYVYSYLMHEQKVRASGNCNILLPTYWCRRRLSGED